MPKREYYHSPQCVHEGCGERANYVFETRRDQQAQMESLQRRGGYRCVRHTRPDAVLSVDNAVREAVLTSYEESYGKFWRESDQASSSGFQYGPGFKAFAKDFPPGTRLIVTARVEVPVASREGRS